MRLFKHPEFVRTKREKLLCDTLEYWGFKSAAEAIDFNHWRLDVEALLKTWAGYPACMNIYPDQLTPKVFDATNNTFRVKQ